MAVLRYAAQEAANIRKSENEAKRVGAQNAALARKKAEQTAAAGYEPAITEGTSAQYLRGDKTWQSVWVAPPFAATSSGIEGQKAYDSSWLYICVATNTWVRTALATW